MYLKTKIGFKPAKVVFFLLLNCLIAVAPLIHLYSGDNHAGTGYLSQKRSSSENSETHQLKNAEEQIIYYYNTRKKKTGHFVNKRIDDNPQSAVVSINQPLIGSISSHYPSLPEYYRFLHLYQLF